jgi:hypothetical protein
MTGLSGNFFSRPSALIIYFVKIYYVIIYYVRNQIFLYLNTFSCTQFEMADRGDLSFSGMTDRELYEHFCNAPIPHSAFTFDGTALNKKKETRMNFNFENEVTRALQMNLFSSSEESSVEEKGEEMDVIQSAFGSSSSEESSEKEEEESSEKEESSERAFETSPICAPVFKVKTKESDEDLKDEAKILERIIEARIRAETNIAKQLIDILRIDVSEFAKEDSVTDAILERFVGNSISSDSPLYNDGAFFIIFTSSILFYAVKIALQTIHQKSDNQKISKSPHPLLVKTQRTDLWRQFWGTTMPDRGQSLDELHADYTTRLPILRIWTYFKQKTSTQNEFAKKPVAKQWCYPLLHSMMYSARFRYTLGRVPGPEDRYCALTGVPIHPGTEAYMCSFLCEVVSAPADTDVSFSPSPFSPSPFSPSPFALSSNPRKDLGKGDLGKGERGKGKKGKGKKGKGKRKDLRKETNHTQPEVQTIGCVIQKTLPALVQEGKGERGKGKRGKREKGGKAKRVSAEPLIKLIRSISEFDKTIASWVKSWVEKFGSKLNNMKRDTIAYALTSAEGLEEIGKWYTTFQVMVAVMNHAVCRGDLGD